MYLKGLSGIKLSLGEIILKASGFFFLMLLFLKKYFISLFERKMKVPGSCGVMIVKPIVINI